MARIHSRIPMAILVVLVPSVVAVELSSAMFANSRTGRAVLPPGNDLRMLRIENVRLEDAPPIAAAASMLLTFDILNTGSVGITDIVVEAAVVAAPSAEGEREQTKVAGPYVIRGNGVLEAGNVMTYTLRLRHLASNCGCSAKVTVRAGRPVRALKTTRLMTL